MTPGWFSCVFFPTPRDKPQTAVQCLMLAARCSQPRNRTPIHRIPSHYRTKVKPFHEQVPKKIGHAQWFFSTIQLQLMRRETNTQQAARIEFLPLCDVDAYVSNN